MNYSTAVFLINNDVRAVMCTYETGETAPRTMFKTFDPDLSEGDFVIVPTNTRHGMTVCKVVETDVDVDFDSAAQVEWIIGTIELANHEKIVAQENQAIEAVKSAEKRKRRDELREAIFKDQEETMKSLALTSLSEASEA